MAEQKINIGELARDVAEKVAQQATESKFNELDTTYTKNEEARQAAEAKRQSDFEDMKSLVSDIELDTPNEIDPNYGVALPNLVVTIGPNPDFVSDLSIQTPTESDPTYGVALPYIEITYGS